MSKPPLVAYRRTSSDMDMSSSDEEEASKPKNREELPSDSNRDNCKDNRNCERQRSPKPEDLRERENGKHDGFDRNRSNGEIPRGKDGEKERTEKKSVDSDRDKDRRDSDRHRKRDHINEKTSSRRRGRSRSRSPHDRHRSPVRKKYSPDRKRHSPDRRERRRSRSPDYRHRSRRSPESFRSKRLERKAARIDKLGLELYAEPKPGVVVSISGRDVVTGFCNAGVNPAARITEQIQKRRMLWQNKKEVVPEPASEPSTSTTWEAATFKGDNDGKMTEKFKRLMGIKGEAAGSTSKGADDSNIIQKQEEMFSNMEAQYQVARMATHTHRGIGLGFGTFQVPPR